MSHLGKNKRAARSAKRRSAEDRIKAEQRAAEQALVNKEKVIE